MSSSWFNFWLPHIKLAHFGSVQVPGNYHVQGKDDPVEDVSEEEVSELVDPEEEGGGEDGYVVHLGEGQ